MEKHLAEITPEKIQKILNEAFGKKGFTKIFIARKLGIHPQNVYRFLKSSPKGKLDLFLKFVILLDLDFKDFFDNDIKNNKATSSEKYL